MTEEFGQAYALKQIDRQQSPFRKVIKSFYVARVLRHVKGRAVDLGCGAGQILKCLPNGSVGIETNPFLVEYLTKQGLPVIQASANIGFDLSGLQPHQFNTLILSHVLEHVSEADRVLSRLLCDCATLGISRVILVVPGMAGFNSDATHKTFIDWNYLRSRKMLEVEGYKIVHRSYFPGDISFLGKVFAYHEMMFIYDRQDQPCLA